MAVLASASTVAMSAPADAQTQDSLSPVGYWVQFDEDNDPGRGFVQGVVHSYFATNDDFAKEGTLQMQIVVPIMNIKNNQITPAKINCDVCGTGHINGFRYNYKNKVALLDGLVFAGNMTPQPGTKKAGEGLEYDNGGVLNPNDGKTYNSKAQVQDNGKTLFARAYKGTGWYAIGKDAHWKRISEDQYEIFNKKCGLNTKTEMYPYQNPDKSINKAEFKECYSYDFGVVNPTK